MKTKVKKRETVNTNKKEGMGNVMNICRPSNVCTIAKQTLQSFTLVVCTNN